MRARGISWVDRQEEQGIVQIHNPDCVLHHFGYHPMEAAGNASERALAQDPLGLISEVGSIDVHNIQIPGPHGRIPYALANCVSHPAAVVHIALAIES